MAYFMKGGPSSRCTHYEIMKNPAHCHILSVKLFFLEDANFVYTNCSLQARCRQKGLPSTEAIYNDMTRVIEAELFSPGNYFHGNSTQQCDSENTYNTKWLYALMVCNGFFCNGFFCNGFFCNGFSDSLEKF